MTDSRDMLAFADSFMSALEGSDRETVRAFYAPDAKLWHNFDNVAQTVDENLKMFDWMSRKLPQRRYRVVRREVLHDGWFQQHVVEATLPDGRPFRLFACCVITVQDGVVTRLEEYVDPAQASVLREVKA